MRLRIIILPFTALLLSGCANISGSGSVNAGSGGDVNVGGSIGVHFPFSDSVR